MRNSELRGNGGILKGGLTSEPDSESSFRLRLVTVTLLSLSSELDKSTYADISENVNNVN